MELTEQVTLSWAAVSSDFKDFDVSSTGIERRPSGPQAATLPIHMVTGTAFKSLTVRSF